MKHNLKVTALLITFFFLAQLVGMGIIYQDIEVVESVTETGDIVKNITHPDTALGERPEAKNFDALIMVLISILIGTGLILIIVKLGIDKIWKAFFFFAVLFSITIALGTLVSFWIALGIALILSVLKLFRSNIIIHNVSEVLIYSGIAVLFVPLFEPLWALIILLIISVYDMFAVWKSKHMIKLAEFQIESKAFAGLFIPPSFKSKISKPSKNVKSGQRAAVIGGGDVAFPLIFAGTVMESLILKLPALIAFAYSLLIPVFVTISLLGLMIYGKKDRYYPAMPFITIGALVGYGLILLL